MTGEFAKEMEALAEIFTFLGEFADQNGLSEEEELSMGLVAEELFTNAVKYGARGDGRVRLTLEKSLTELRLELVDHGAEPFDAESAETAPLGDAIEKRRAGGLGLHLVRSLMDEVAYEYRDGELKVMATKHLGS